MTGAVLIEKLTMACSKSPLDNIRASSHYLPPLVPCRTELYLFHVHLEPDSAVQVS